MLLDGREDLTVLVNCSAHMAAVTVVECSAAVTCDLICKLIK